ncbi:MAG: hypothetical protein ACOX20_06430 [Limnochordia bacterium]
MKVIRVGRFIQFTNRALRNWAYLPRSVANHSFWLLTLVFIWTISSSVGRMNSAILGMKVAVQINRSTRFEPVEKGRLINFST